MLAPASSAQTLQTIFEFPYGGSVHPNGSMPTGLTLANDGNFYGTTREGGSAGVGTFFRITPNGALTTLSSFAGSNGAHPEASPTLGRDGLLYGMTYDGGTGVGNVYKASTNGNISNFVSFNYASGSSPNGPLALGSDGNFYGSTYYGGAGGFGCVFRLTPDGTITPLASSFSFSDTNGSHPIGAPLLARDGYLYVPMATGGTLDAGTIVSVSTNGGLTLLDTFTITNGADPESELAYGADGQMYGVTGSGGTAGGGGVIFRFSRESGIRPLVSLSAGQGPVGPMVLARDGNFYGTTQGGGSSGFGTVFQFTTQGLFSTVASFTNSRYPSGLALGPDGNLYGTTLLGPGGSVASAFRFSLDPPKILSQPAIRTNHLGTLATFSAPATSLPNVPISYQWLKNGAPLADGGNISGASSVQLAIASVSLAEAAVYSVMITNVFGVTISSNATLVVDQTPYFSVQPVSQTIGIGGNVSFAANAVGPPPLLFQWYFNGSPVGGPAIGTADTSFSIVSTSSNLAGDYFVTVTDSQGTATSAVATLTVVQTPVISVHPSSQLGAAGKSVTFSVVASGIAPLAYQWKWYGTNLSDGGQISGSTSNSLTISNLNDRNAGPYSVAISNLAGVAISSNAFLSIIDPPLITSQPISQRVGVGSTVTFNVGSSGTYPFQFQWKFNGVNLPGATSSVYVIPAATGTNAGNYLVTVGNFAGSVTSSNATLSVLVPPTLKIQVLSGYPVLNLNGLLGYNYFVQASTNLAEANWINVLTISNLSASPYQFLDPAGTTKPSRFYRAVMQ